MADRSLASVFVSVIPDTRETGRLIQRDLGKVDTTKAGHDAGHKFGSGFTSGAKSIISGVGGIVAAAGIGKVLVDSVQGFRAHNQVVAQSNAVIRSTKGVANASSKSLQTLSDQLERKTKVDGDVILSGENMLATFTGIRNEAGKGNDVFNQATKTLLDLATATGTDAPKAAIQLGKALNDPVKGVTALTKVGVTFDAQQQKQIASYEKAGKTAEAQKVILRELNKEFGGSAKAQGDALGAQGRLTVAYHQAQDAIGGALLPVVNELEGALADRLPAAADAAAKAITSADTGFKQLVATFKTGKSEDETYTRFERIGLAVRNLNGGFQGQGPIKGYTGALNTFGLGVRALIDAYKDPDVTSNGFVGTMEKIGAEARKAHDYLATLDFHQFAGDAKTAGDSLAHVDVKGFADQLKSVDTSHIGDGIKVFGAGLGFVADHIDLVVKAMPVLIAAYAAYKGAEAAGNVAAVASIPLKAAQIASNIILARSIKSLAAGNAEEAVASGVASGAETVKLAVTNAATASTERGTFATIASATAQKVVAAATKVWAGVQFVLNAVLSANPIALVIIGIAALAGGIIYAYKHSDTFRAVVQAAFKGVTAAGQSMLDFLRPVFAGLVGFWLTAVGGIVNGAAKAFGWVPGIGGKLKSAAAAFNHFRDQVNAALSGVKSRTVTVKATTLIAGGVDRSTAIGDALHRADGGAIRGPGSGTSDSIAAYLSNGEHVWTAREVTAAGGHLAVAQMRKSALSGAKAFAGGGPVSFDVTPVLAGMPTFRSNLAAFNQKVDAAVAAAALRQIAASDAASGVPSSVSGNAALGRTLAASQYGWVGAQWAALYKLWQRESGWRNTAQNPTSTAYGIPQFLNSTWASVGGQKTSDARLQEIYGMRYIASRYGSPSAAWAHELSAGWYDGGGWLPKGASVALNGTGRPERIRTGPQEDRLEVALRRIEARLASRGAGSPLIGEFHAHDRADIDLVLAQVEFRQRGEAGGF